MHDKTKKRGQIRTTNLPAKTVAAKIAEIDREIERLENLLGDEYIRLSVEAQHHAYGQLDAYRTCRNFFTI